MSKYEYNDPVYSGFGLEAVEVGKTYFVQNGHWEFKVIEILPNGVTARFLGRNNYLPFKADLYLEER